MLVSQNQRLFTKLLFANLRPHKDSEDSAFMMYKKGNDHVYLELEKQAMRLP